MIPVQFITNSSERYTHEQSAALALQGGCKWIQLRMKDSPAEDKKEQPSQENVLEMEDAEEEDQRSNK